MKDKKPILFCFGTRPEWLKIKPLVKIMEKGSYELLFTGQHPDLLDDIEVDYQIKMSNSTFQRLDTIITDCMVQFPEGDFRGVLVQGDTGSAFGCAIAAFNRGLKIYYLEAGLRSYNLSHPYPEEGYRQMISRIADICFSPTQLSADNLVNEKVSGEIHITGNSVLDNLMKYDVGEYGKMVLVTLHRRENHPIMDKWFIELDKLAERYSEYNFILPIHPNPNVKRHRKLLKNVHVVEPLTHEGLIEILRNSLLVITDSGGLQEEGSFFNKKVIVCRKTTERPEGIDTGHLHMCENPDDLNKLFEELEKNPYIDKNCPYGDGNASELIKDILNEEF